MIIGLGIDLVENSRVQQELARGAWLLGDGIFTQDELRYCGGSRKPALRYAVCFAAKEATIKGLNLRISDLAMFREVEVKAVRQTDYEVVLHGRLKTESEKLGVRQIWLSVARDTTHTTAVVILEG